MEAEPESDGESIQVGIPADPDDLASLEAALADIRAVMAGSSQCIADSVTALAQGLQPVLDSFQESMRSLTAGLLDGLRETFSELPPRTRRAILALAEHGWYYDSALSFQALWALESTLSSGDLQAVDDSLCAHFEEELASIVDLATVRFPHRERFLTAAIDAHINGDYALSIPLLFAQVDL